MDDCKPLPTAPMSPVDTSKPCARPRAVLAALPPALVLNSPTCQWLTLVHFSAQLEPCLTHKNTLHTLTTP